MTKRPQDILARALADIEAGRVSVEDPLSTHREVGRKLDPLVHFALALRPPDLPAASDATRQRVLSELRQAVEAEEQMDAKPSSLMAIAGDMLLALGGAASRIPESLRLAFGFVFAAVLILASVHHAAANSLPGDPVYAVKRLEESVTLTLARSPEAKARTYLALAALRLSEAHTLYRTGADNRAKATTVEYSGSIVKGLGYLTAAEGELPVAELREQYGQALLIYQAATAQSPYLWDDDTRAVLRKAWEGFASGGTDSNSGSRDDDRGDGNAHVWEGDHGQPIGKGVDDDGSTSAQPAVRDQGPASSRSEDDKINTGDQPEAAGEGTRPAEKSQRSQPESRLEGVESGDKSHGSQSAADHRGAQPEAKHQAPPAGKAKDNAGGGAQSAEKGRGPKLVAKAQDDQPETKDHGPPAGKAKDNAGRGAQSAEKGRGSKLVAKAQDDQPEAKDQGPPAGKAKDNASRGVQSAEKGRGPKLVAKAQDDQPEGKGPSVVLEGGKRVSNDGPTGRGSSRNKGKS